MILSKSSTIHSDVRTTFFPCDLIYIFYMLFHIFYGVLYALPLLVITYSTSFFFIRFHIFSHFYEKIFILLVTCYNALV